VSGACVGEPEAVGVETIVLGEKNEIHVGDLVP
jgi:hypothetical protein